jgi:glycosyltransferase involved in cell wall biosynthesis
MRIAFLTSAFSYGGAQMSTVELAERLSRIHNVKFFDTYGSSEPFMEALSEKNIDYSILSKSSSTFIVSKYKNRLFNIFRYFLFFFKWYQIRLNTREKLVQFNPDIVIVYDDRCLSYLINYKNKRFKTLFYARGWYTPEQIPLITKILLKKYSDVLICISEATKHALYCNGIAPLDKLFVVHNSININKLLSNLKPIENFKSTFNIIHSGGFLPSKGQLVSLEAAKIMREKNINFHLYLCGIIYPGIGDKSRKYFEKLKDYVKVNNLSNFVSFVEGESNIISYILNSDIMFFPSSTEGLPRSVIEAMALGKPVVANAVGGVTDLILDRFTGFITRHNEPLDYANFAQLLFSDEDLYQKISMNAKNLILTAYNEDLQIVKMNKIFENIMR